MIIKRWNSSFTSAKNASTTNGSTTVTLINGNTTKDLVVGTGVTGTGIPVSTTIASITDTTTIVLSNAATATGGNVVLTFTGVFAEQYPKTVAQKVFNDAGNIALFDVNNKLKLQYLPDAVYDSLYFHDTIGSVVQDDQEQNVALKDIASYAFNFPISGRSKRGNYYVATTTTTLTTNSTGQQGAYGTLYFKTVLAGREENLMPGGTSVVLEPGDWVVITKEDSTGSNEPTTQNGSTIAGAITVTFSVVNNTYELMTGATASVAGAPGLVPGPAANQNLHFLRGDGTWVIPTNTTYTGSTSIILNNGSFERAALTGDVTSSQNSNTMTIASDAVTFAKMQNIATSTILGRNDAGTGDIEALTASEVRTLLNVADGATANTGTVTSVATSGTVSGLTLTGGTITTSGTITLGGTLAVLPSNFASQTANTVLIAPNGAAGTPTFRALVAADIPTLNQNTTGTAANVTGTVAVANGGTGQTSYTDGQLLIGNSTGNTLSKATLTAGTSITITNGSGAITIANAAPNATHTGDVTGSGALTIAAAAVTYAKIQNISATNRILGRITAGAGSTEELTASNVRSIIELAAPIYVQTATPTTTINNSLWYDITP